jgi:hypothetical protein
LFGSYKIIIHTFSLLVLSFWHTKETIEPSKGTLFCEQLAQIEPLPPQNQREQGISTVIRIEKLVRKVREPLILHRDSYFSQTPRFEIRTFNNYYESRCKINGSQTLRTNFSARRAADITRAQNQIGTVDRCNDTKFKKKSNKIHKYRTF